MLRRGRKGQIKRAKKYALRNERLINAFREDGKRRGVEGHTLSALALNSYDRIGSCTRHGGPCVSCHSRSRQRFWSKREGQGDQVLPKISF